MAKKKGIVKKTALSEYANIRKSGLQAINLKDDDDLIEVKLTDSTKDILLVTKNGMCIRFDEKDVRDTGRSSMGVIGMTIDDTDEIVAMQLNTQGNRLLIVSENGFGKRTDIDEFTPQRRGGKGVKCYKIVEKTGFVIGAKAVNDNNDIMLITKGGIVIRMAVDGISTLGRITSGVKLMNIDEDAVIAQIAKVRESENQGETDEENTEAEGNPEERDNPEDEA